MRRKIIGLTLTGLCLLGAGILWHSLGSAEGPANGNGQVKPPPSPLPIKHVVLFNSGMGYFQREGEVAGNVRVNLSFPVGDINDLLKSLVLQDLGGGHISTVNYDSQDPLDKILRSFALDLNNNPTFGQILNQARGEKIEVLRKDQKNAGQTKLAGTIVGMEVQRKPVGKDQVADIEMGAAKRAIVNSFSERINLFLDVGSAPEGRDNAVHAGKETAPVSSLRISPLASPDTGPQPGA